MELDNWGIKLNSYYTFEHSASLILRLNMKR